MGRRPCCSKEGLNRGAWTALEDNILTCYINAHGEGNWRKLPNKAGLKRCGKSCRLRWLNYLKPGIKRGNISLEEEDLILRLHKLLGNRWSLIAARLPGRTDNEIKNYWNTNLSKKANGYTQVSSQLPNTKPGSRKRVIEPKTTKPSESEKAIVTQAIRTKATRPCTKMLVSLLGIPDDTSNSNVSCVNYPEDSFKLIQQSEEFDASQNLLEFGGHNRLSANSDQILSFNEQIMRDFNSNNNSDCVQDNWNLELESLAFLLDHEEWP